MSVSFCADRLGPASRMTLSPQRCSPVECHGEPDSQRRIPTALDLESSSRLRKRHADAQDSDADSIARATSYVTCIEEFHGTAKCCIFNPLLVRQIQSIGEGRFSMCRFSLANSESIFAGDCKLRVTEAKWGVEDFSVRGPAKSWVKFPDSLGYSRSAGGTLFSKSFA